MEQNLSKTPIKWRASAIVLAICLVLMVVTSVIGHNIQTSGLHFSESAFQFPMDNQ